MIPAIIVGALTAWYLGVRLGVIIAIVKLSGFATAEIGWGAFGLTVVALAMASLSTFDPGALWRRADEIAR